MELKIHFKTLPRGIDLERMKAEVAGVLEEDGWLTGSGLTPAGGYLELELEDERANPKYGILAVKSYLCRAGFSPDTEIELAGVCAGIYNQ